MDIISGRVENNVYAAYHAFRASAPDKCGLFFRGESFVKATMILAHEYEGLCLRLGFQGREQVHMLLVIEHAFGHGDGEGRALDQTRSPLVGCG